MRSKTPEKKKRMKNSMDALQGLREQHAAKHNRAGTINIDSDSDDPSTGVPSKNTQHFIKKPKEVHKKSEVNALMDR